MPRVTVRNNNVEAALRVFKRTVTNAGILFEYRQRQEYDKPSAKRHKARQSAKLREKKRQNEIKTNKF
ncbi:MAG TPA: 30S ribosomal protein S21 [Saprospirales bacterium]|nr:30S ribosomal protein S21 [Saprospirales bacterium]